MPSRAEGFGLVGTEVLAQGIPILVSDRSGLGETIRELAPDMAKNFVVPVSEDLETDAQAWREGIAFVLRDQDASLRRTEELRSRLVGSLSWDRMAAEILRGIGG